MRKTGKIKRNGEKTNERKPDTQISSRMNKISHLYTLMFRVFAIRLLDNFVI